MSIIGKKPIQIPAGVKVEIKDRRISVTGPKGSLDFDFRPEVKVEMVGEEVKVEKVGQSKEAPAIWGTTARIVANMVEGVTNGFTKKLELNGVGYRMAVQGTKINLALGFSHPVEVPIPEGLTVKIEANVMEISGINKQHVGQFAADIKSLKPVEPYKGKGFRYAGQFVRRKEGKKAGTAA